MHDSQTPRPPLPRTQVVPHVEVCPACAGPIEGRSCKVYCTNPGCELCGRVIENCAGD